MSGQRYTPEFKDEAVKLILCVLNIIQFKKNSRVFYSCLIRFYTLFRGYCLP